MTLKTYKLRLHLLLWFDVDVLDRNILESGRSIHFSWCEFHNSLYFMLLNG